MYIDYLFILIVIKNIFDLYQKLRNIWLCKFIDIFPIYNGYGNKLFKNLEFYYTINVKNFSILNINIFLSISFYDDTNTCNILFFSFI